jgi:putrescine transport system ATP-binding protein
VDAHGEPGYLSIRDLRKEFDGFVAVDDVNLDVRKGEIFALLGGSGSGKSTLLRCLGGFETPTKGRILLDGQSLVALPPYKRPVNMMFQSYALFPHMTVEQNIAFGLKQDGLASDAIQRRVGEMLELVHMTSLAKRRPHQLSGGQQQRVALARSLAKGPKLLLLDEPMGALDKKLRSQMQLELVNIIETSGVTCVMVTHDQEEAMTMATRVAVMDAGWIQQVGKPDEVYEQPANRFVAGFIGSVNSFEGVIDEDLPEYATVHTNKAQGVIEDIAYFGSHSVYHVRLPSGAKVMANFANSQRWASDGLTWGDAVWVHWRDNDGVVLTS